jgi:hypothetical protein
MSTSSLMYSLGDDVLDERQHTVTTEVLKNECDAMK